jgi:hypothetical protein
MSVHRILTGEMGDDRGHVEVAVRIWDDHDATMAEVAFRSDPSHTWRPPIVLVQVPS